MLDVMGGDGGGGDLARATLEIIHPPSYHDF